MTDEKENYVIVRTDKAGVFFGILRESTATSVTLEKCRKLFYWSGAAAIEQIALDGIAEEAIKDCKFTVIIEVMQVNNWNQIIPVSKKAINNIQTIPVWQY